MGGADELGFEPGWVVTYAPRSKEYGTAFFVSFLGKILARGTPSLVSRQHKQDRVALEKFGAGFAKLDAAVQVGSTFSNVVSVVGTPHTAFTNSDGSLSVFYHYLKLPSPPVGWLTNGFSLIVSNGIVVHKGYSYTSSR
jgi:hypothetical protein